jgi:hypothetical protein
MILISLINEEKGGYDGGSIKLQSKRQTDVLVIFCYFFLESNKRGWPRKERPGGGNDFI